MGSEQRILAGRSGPRCAPRCGPQAARRFAGDRRHIAVGELQAQAIAGLEVRNPTQRPPAGVAHQREAARQHRAVAERAEEVRQTYELGAAALVAAFLRAQDAGLEGAYALAVEIETALGAGREPLRKR